MRRTCEGCGGESYTEIYLRGGTPRARVCGACNGTGELPREESRGWG